jgi:hypothetical protein
MRPVRLALTPMLLAALIVSTVLPASGGAALGPAVALGGAARGLGPDRAAGSAARPQDTILRIADRQPLDAVLRSIRERFPGRALEAREIESDGRAVYRIKWLGDDGKVRDILADATTGEIVRVR